jgi:hypothetical protein
MKQITILIFFSLSLTLSKGQTIPVDYANTIKEQANIMGQLLIKKDFNAFINYTYPKVIEMVGGKKKLLKILEKDSKKMLAEGTTILNVTIGEPSKIISIGKELQCIVPQAVEIKVPNGRLISESSLIAISSDNGQHWYFIDASGSDIKTMKRKFPNLSGALVIPLYEKPVFYAD